MWHLRSFICHLGTISYTLLTVLWDAVRFLMLCFRPVSIPEVNANLELVAGFKLVRLPSH
jgi:hypothetical protein